MRIVRSFKGDSIREEFNKYKVLPGLVVHACNPCYLGDRERRIEFETSCSKGSETLPQKQNKNKRAGGASVRSRAFAQHACARPCVQSLVLQKKKKKENSTSQYIVVQDSNRYYDFFF
jgi:hypothetical protein